jgi:hypothetical protein
MSSGGGPEFGWGGLFVGDHLANFGDVLLESGDFFRPGTFGVRVRDSGGVLAFGLGEAEEEVVEAILEGGAGHRQFANRLETEA